MINRNSRILSAALVGIMGSLMADTATAGGTMVATSAKGKGKPSDQEFVDANKDRFLALVEKRRDKSYTMSAEENEFWQAYKNAESHLVQARESAACKLFRAALEKLTPDSNGNRDTVADIGHNILAMLGNTYATTDKGTKKANRDNTNILAGNIVAYMNARRDLLAKAVEFTDELIKACTAMVNDAPHKSSRVTRLIGKRGSKDGDLSALMAEVMSEIN